MSKGGVLGLACSGWAAKETDMSDEEADARTINAEPWAPCPAW